MTPAENLPILYQNIIYGMPNELAVDAFLWAVERPDEDSMCYRAERFAHEVAALVSSLAPMLDAAARIHGMGSHDTDLMNFILKRHANWRYQGNQSPEYCQ